MDPALAAIFAKRSNAVAPPSASAETPVTPADLLTAAKTGELAKVKCLLDAGVDSAGQDNQGSTALHIAAAEGHAEVVKLLLERGANVQAKNKRGLTPLHVACSSKQAATAEVLLDGGAPLDATDSHGVTALHLACERRAPAVVEVLLRRGADKEAKDKGGDSALDIAKRCPPKDRRAMLQLLDGSAASFAAAPSAAQAAAATRVAARDEELARQAAAIEAKKAEAAAAELSHLAEKRRVEDALVETLLTERGSWLAQLKQVKESIQEHERAAAESKSAGKAKAAELRKQTEAAEAEAKEAEADLEKLRDERREASAALIGAQRALREERNATDVSAALVAELEAGEAATRAAEDELAMARDAAAAQLEPLRRQKEDLRAACAKVEAEAAAIGRTAQQAIGKLVDTEAHNLTTKTDLAARAKQTRTHADAVYKERLALEGQLKQAWEAKRAAEDKLKAQTGHHLSNDETRKLLLVAANNPARHHLGTDLYGFEPPMPSEPIELLEAPELWAAVREMLAAHQAHTGRAGSS